jgi:hypothetical protein
MSSIIPFIIIFIVLRIIATSVGSCGGMSMGPKRTVQAMIVAKRMNCSRHHHGAEIIDDHDPTTYHVTFQIDKGPRIELQVKESQYDLLYDGDRGKLTYKGKRFIRFNAV